MLLKAKQLWICKDYIVFIIKTHDWMFEELCFDINKNNLCLGTVYYYEHWRVENYRQSNVYEKGQKVDE